MPLFEIQTDVRSDLWLTEECALDDYQFLPKPDGFGLQFEIEGASIEEARRKAVAKVQLLVDAITFTKGPSSHYNLSKVTQLPTKQAGSPQVLTSEVSISASAYFVLKTGREGIADGVSLAGQVLRNEKAEVLTRVLRWYARATAETDTTDKFIDYWIALEALADSYTGEVDAYECPRCEHVLNPRPVNGLLRAYLRSLGMNQAADRIPALAGLRGKLFHEALTGASEYIQEVQEMLRNCITGEMAGRSMLSG
jgi:hypothetical protein